MSFPAATAVSPRPTTVARQVVSWLVAPPGRTLGAWAIWAAMTVAGLWLAGAHGLTMPFSDEWTWLPQVVGREPVTFAWLWGQHNEHRMFLPRLIYLGLGTMFGFDSRAGAIFNALALSGLAAALMFTARAIRGRTSLCDAFFPLAIQHWGPAENLIWGFQLNFVTSVVLTTIILMPITRCRGRLTPGAAVSIAACLAAAGLCGAYGLAAVPTAACWLLWAGLAAWRRHQSYAGRDLFLLTALAALLLALCVVYFVGYVRPPQHLDAPGVRAILRTALQFLSMGLGQGAKEIWPAAGAIILVAWIYSACQLVNAFCRRPAERLRAGGLLSFLATMTLLALGIGWGRAFFGPRAGLTDRYITLAMPLLCLFYLQWLIYSGPASSRHLQRAMFLLMCVLCVVNTRKGFLSVRGMEGPIATLASDIRAGIPPEGLSLRHGEHLGFAPTSLFAERLTVLRRARLGPYRDAVENGPYRAAQVKPLVEFTPSGRPPNRFRLRAGEQVVQTLVIPRSADLLRIDIMARPWDRGWHCLVLDWALCERPSVGPPVPRANGRIDLGQRDEDDYISLRFAPIFVRGPRQLDLVFSLASQMPGETGAEFFPFGGVPAAQTADGKASAFGGPPQSLRGFLFFTPGGKGPVVNRQ
jgi:hypothetical protein